MRKSILALTILLLGFTLLPIGAVTIDQSYATLETNAATDRTSRVHVAQSYEDLLVAYQTDQGKIALGRLTDDGWQSSTLPLSGTLQLQGLTADRNMIVVAYLMGGDLYTATSTDNGGRWQTSNRLAARSETPSIQGLAIDSNRTIQVIFHRHDRYWDQNWAYSTNDGRTYTVRNAFTRSTDSSSTGYAGSMVAAHGRLYTVYRDNNNGMMIKLGVLEDTSRDWRILPLSRIKGHGMMSFSVDPRDQNTVYIGSIDEEKLEILKVTGATTTPRIQTIYKQRTAVHKQTLQASMHLDISITGEIIAFYFNPAKSMYEVLLSIDEGTSWHKADLEVGRKGEAWAWGADAIVIEEYPFFVRSDAAGNLLVHGVGTEQESHWDDEEFDFDEDDLWAMLGITAIANPHQPFTITYDEEMEIVMLSARVSGPHQLINYDHDKLQVTMILSDTETDDEEVLWNLDDDFNFTDRTFVNLVAGHTYMLATSLFDTSAIGAQVRMVLQAVGGSTALAPVVTSPPTSTRKTVEIKDIERIGAGSYTSYVVNDRERILVSGSNQHGQLGQGSVPNFTEFTSIMVYSKAATGGVAHSLFLGTDGRLYGAGRNEEGQLTLPAARINTPTVIADKVVDMAAGFGHSLFIKRDGTLWSVGANDYGQLGTGSTRSSREPQKIMDNIARVWSNFSHVSFALDKDGVLYGWGMNTNGQLGLGPNAPSSVLKPTRITDNVVEVAPGFNFTWILKADGQLYGVGSNNQGQLGYAVQDATKTLTKIAQRVNTIAAGEETGFYIDIEDRLWAGGSNRFGQWGVGHTHNYPDASGFKHVLNNVKAVAAGAHHAIVLRTDGTVWSSGSNSNGQLGDRTEGFRANWKQVATVVD